MSQMSQEKLREYEIIFVCLQDPTNWKNSTRYIDVWEIWEATEISKALSYFCGGAEVKEFTDKKGQKRFNVGSKGYYHYIGA